MTKGFLQRNIVAIPDYELMNFRLKSKKNILFSISGGIGDRVCAEPAIRWFTKNFPNYNYTIVSKNPEFFKHIENCNNITDKDNYDFENNLVLVSMWHEKSISHNYYNNLTIHPVDYASLNLFKTVLPNSHDKLIKISFEKTNDLINNILKKTTIAVHPGISWKTKTLSFDFYKNIINKLAENKNINIAIIGKTGEGVSCYNDFDIKEENVFNLINKTDIEELGFLLKKSKGLITNDSSCIHMACTKDSKTKIGYISLVKNDEYLSHWRLNYDEKLEFGFNMKNFAKIKYGNIFANPLFSYFNRAENFLTDKQIEQAMPSIDDLITYVLN